MIVVWILAGIAFGGFIIVTVNTYWSWQEWRYKKLNTCKCGHSKCSHVGQDGYSFAYEPRNRFMRRYHRWMRKPVGKKDFNTSRFCAECVGKWANEEHTPRAQGKSQS